MQVRSKIQTALVVVGALLSAASVAKAAGPTKGLTVDDMLAMQRVGEPAVSPNGTWVAYTLRTTDVAANRGRTDIWLAAVDGSGVRRLTTAPDSESSPTWSPDGNYVYFLSARGGRSQVWRIAPSGGEAEVVTDVAADIGGFKIFPDGKRLLLAIEVWPTAKSLAASNKLDDDQAKASSSAKAYDALLFRHWDTWEDGKYSHLFTWTPRASSSSAESVVDITPGLGTDAPTHPFGGMEEISISSDGKHVAYVIRNSGGRNAWSTNTDVFWVSSDGRSKAMNLTADNPAYDFAPTLSPDGKSIAILSMARAGYEADRQRVRIIDLASRKSRTLTEAWDRSANSLSWSPDSKQLYTSADNLGQQSIFSIDAASGNVKLLIEKSDNSSPTVAGARLVYLHNSLRQPTEIFTASLDGSDAKAITHHNDARVAAIAWGDYEQFTFQGANGDTVYGYAMKPAKFNGKKAPVALLIHGGPQGSMGDHFHYRWNPQAFAGVGFASVFIDFHGSTGYGQKFTDAIRGDWGGAPYQDQMKGLDAALAKFSWLDGNRAVAAGASYGGYMINWINGHTDRFKALVVHDGNLDERMAYYDTEELWFPEWEHGGTPWENPAGYTTHNPIDFVKNWKTPTLVIHGALDFRVVDTQGMSTFTALQRKGIPSRFLHFPDENHWILKPQNSQRWHQEVLAWITKYTK
ncbi:MAG: S9 family peptidase [Kofleriaceae bacterium]|nr:S9 family peptidase [Kofleriaceae bacterium]